MIEAEKYIWRKTVGGVDSTHCCMDVWEHSSVPAIVILSIRGNFNLPDTTHHPPESPTTLQGCLTNEKGLNIRRNYWITFHAARDVSQNGASARAGTLLLPIHLPLPHWARARNEEQPDTLQAPPLRSPAFQRNPGHVWLTTSSRWAHGWIQWRTRHLR